MKIPQTKIARLLFLSLLIVTILAPNTNQRNEDTRGGGQENRGTLQQSNGQGELPYSSPTTHLEQQLGQLERVLGRQLQQQQGQQIRIHIATSTAQGTFGLALVRFLDAISYHQPLLSQQRQQICQLEASNSASLQLRQLVKFELNKMKRLKRLTESIQRSASTIIVSASQLARIGHRLNVQQGSSVLPSLLRCLLINVQLQSTGKSPMSSAIARSETFKFSVLAQISVLSLNLLNISFENVIKDLNQQVRALQRRLSQFPPQTDQSSQIEPLTRELSQLQTPSILGSIALRNEQLVDEQAPSTSNDARRQLESRNILYQSQEVRSQMQLQSLPQHSRSSTTLSPSSTRFPSNSRSDSSISIERRRGRSRSRLQSPNEQSSSSTRSHSPRPTQAKRPRSRSPSPHH